LGRPYQLELDELHTTFQWSRNIDVSALRERLSVGGPEPLIVIGSGGSLSSACFASTLHQDKGLGLSYFDTPLLAQQMLASSRRAKILIVSARGRNPDVLGFARAAMTSETHSLTSLCCMKASPLSKLVSSYGRGAAYEFDSPSGKDGYLATNSLVALNTILARAYSAESELPNTWEEISNWSFLEEALNKPYADGPAAIRQQQLLLLFGPDTRSAAVDFESKFNESGLASVQVTDYRNFAHGRHLWLHRHPETPVLMFVSPRDKDLAEKTRSKLPKSCSVFILETKLARAGASMEMQAAVFQLVAYFAKDRGWDPGKPIVPQFGRKLYHLNAYTKISLTTKSAAIARKQGSRRAVGLDEIDPKECALLYDCVKNSLENAKFTDCVLDYDGTLCDHGIRFGGLSPNVAEVLITLLTKGIKLGVATGRGRSVRSALAEALPKKLWRNVTVAYYNGGLVLPLSDASSLDHKKPADKNLVRASVVLRRSLLPTVRMTERPYQITLESGDALASEALWRFASEALAEDRKCRVRVVMSSRSVDVLPESASKLNILAAMGVSRPSRTALCIGDQPAWPGNDFELLRQPFSLSVDDVSPLPGTAWNMASPGLRGTAALLEYLGSALVQRGSFKLRFKTP
jgi:fructoselysine-6-P-deglycase FrlB-like protein